MYYLYTVNWSYNWSRFSSRSRLKHINHIRYFKIHQTEASNTQSLVRLIYTPTTHYSLVQRLFPSRVKNFFKKKRKYEPGFDES